MICFPFSGCSGTRRLIQHQTRHHDPFAPKGFQREERMVDPAESRPSDEHDRESKLNDQVAHRPVLTSRNEEAAGPFNDHERISFGQLRIRLEDILHINASSLRTGSSNRSERCTESVRADELQRIFHACRGHQSTGVALIKRVGLHAGSTGFITPTEQRI